MSQCFMNRFVQHFKSFLLSDKYAIGSTLPAEEDLARELNIDIQEVRKGIVELTAHFFNRPEKQSIIQPYRVSSISGFSR